MTGALVWMALCAWLNRWRGHGGFDQWPSNVQRAIISAVLALPAILASPVHGGVIFVLIWVFGFGFGWGSYFGMDEADNPPEVYWIDRLIRNMKGVRRDYWGMSLRGLMFTVPTAVVASLLNPLALTLAPLGVLMAPTYWYANIAPAEIAWGAILGAIFFDMGLLMAWSN
jgi:hypothetical protein